MRVRHRKHSLILRLVAKFVPPDRMIGAITIYPFIFYLEESPSKSLVRHELIHVEQVRRVGWFKFYLSYLMFYWAWRMAGTDHNTAYLKIPWENEAYNRQNDDRVWLNNGEPVAEALVQPEDWPDEYKPV